MASHSGFHDCVEVCNNKPGADGGLAKQDEILKKSKSLVSSPELAEMIGN